MAAWSPLMTSPTDVALTLLRIGEALDLLAVRGLRAAGPDDTAQLQAFRDELAGMGAMHLARLLEVLLTRVKDGRREAPRAFLHAHTALRMLERLYTIRRVDAQLVTVVAPDATVPDVELRAVPSTQLPKDIKGAFLGSLSSAVEDLLLAGLTAASDATVQTLRVGFQEASGRKLLRLGSTLRMVTEEIARYTTKQKTFAPERFVFFAARAWMLARGMADALERGDDALWSRLAWTPPTQMVDEISLVICGVFKRHVPNAFASFEMRCRSLSDVGPIRAGEPLIWSFIFPMRAKSEIPPEAHLLLKQKQKFAPGDLLEGQVVTVRKAAMSLMSPPRLLLGPSTQVEVGEHFDGWRDIMAWDPLRTLSLVRGHHLDPLELPVELQDEVLLDDWTIGPFGSTDRPYESAELKSGELVFEARVDLGESGAPLRAAIQLASKQERRPPLFGFVHFEHGVLIFQPLSVLRDDGPDHVHLNRKNIDKAALVKALRFD